MTYSSDRMTQATSSSRRTRVCFGAVAQVGLNWLVPGWLWSCFAWQRRVSITSGGVEISNSEYTGEYCLWEANVPFGRQRLGISSGFKASRYGVWGRTQSNEPHHGVIGGVCGFV